jgi:hypothetical protein
VYAEWRESIGEQHERLKERRRSTDARKEVGLDVNTKKTKYMMTYRHQNAGRNRDMRIVNRSFENLAKFKDLD